MGYTKKELKAMDIKGKKEHYETYQAMAEKLGTRFLEAIILSSISKSEITDAVKNGEGRLNEIRLSIWDSMSYGLRHNFRHAKINYSTSNGVCVLKHVAKYYIGGMALPEGIEAKPKNPLSMSTDELRAELES